jgi:hypothetical protein
VSEVTSETCASTGRVEWSNLRAEQEAIQSVDNQIKRLSETRPARAVSSAAEETQSFGRHQFESKPFAINLKVNPKAPHDDFLP